jgi:hypothetical protein
MTKWTLLLLVAWLSGASVLGQHVRERFTLTSGWNAIHLESQPVSNRVSVVFSDPNIESIWYWNRRDMGPDLLASLNKAVAEPDEWLVFNKVPGSGGKVRNLVDVDGGSAYLVKVREGATAVVDFTGIPARPRTDWVPGAFNLVGFNLLPASSHTFGTLLAGSSAHSKVSIYELFPDGRWRRIASPDTTLVARNRSYWIETRGSSRHPGPFRLDGEQGSTVTFASDLPDVGVILTPVSSGVSELMVSLSTPAIRSGYQPLTFLRFRDLGASNFWEWVNLPTGSQYSVNLTTNLSRPLRVTVDKARLLESVAKIPEGFGGVITVSDPRGFFVQLPVAVDLNNVSAVVARSSLAKTRTGLPLDPTKIGLWVGQVIVSNVSQANHANVSLRTNPVPSGGQFTMKMILHYDEQGQLRLLNSAALFFNPTNSGNKLSSGLLIVTDDFRRTTPGLRGIIPRGDGFAARRFSAPAFGGVPPLPLALTGGFRSGTARSSWVMDYNHRLNPFVHLYHPDHDNKPEDRDELLPSGMESYTIQRDILLEFADKDPFPEEVPGWGDYRIGGKYREIILGLHREPIHANGIFSLQRLSQTERLNR